MMNELKKSLIELEVIVDNLMESVLRLYGKENYMDNSYGIKTDNIIKFENIFGWNAFSKRKAKSLTLCSERNDTNKVIEINNEMIERYTQMEESKKQSDFYKQFVYMFYSIRKCSISTIA